MKSKQQRHAHILETLGERGRVEVSELAAELGVSEMTCRRDLVELETAGSLRRTHGGAVNAVGRALEPAFRVRQDRSVAQKRAIAARAAQEVRDGDAIALDVGSTGLTMIPHLTQRSDLTITTANLRTAWEIANALSLESTARLIVAGGVVRAEELAMSGVASMNHYNTMRVDVAFLGVGGIDPDNGVTDYNLEDAELKRILTSTAKRVIVLADASKLGQETFAFVCGLDSVDLLITDDGADPELLERFRKAGLEVAVARADD